MNNKTKSILYFLRLPLLFIIIVIVSLYLILIANGYIINLQSKSLLKTGMIYLKSNPKDASIFLNGVQKADKTPIRLTELVGGRYDIQVSKDGYSEWIKTIKVEQGLVAAENDIVLFYLKPQSVQIQNDEIEAFNNLPNKIINSEITIKDLSEIWIPSPDNSEENILVTRLSQPIKNAVYYSDKKHIIFQVENEIRAIDLDGSNNVKLIDLPTNNKTELIIDNTGQYLYYKSSQDVLKVKIH